MEKGRQFPVSILICDIDKLKLINDEEGHEAGDKAILSVARILNLSFRRGDVIARIGGDEFAVILPYYDMEENASAANRLEKAIDDHNSEDGADGLYRPISLSYGFSVISSGSSFVEGFKQADRQMYLNKVMNHKVLSTELDVEIDDPTR